MNDDAPDLPAAVTTKSLGYVWLSTPTTPVGWNGVPSAAAGSATRRPWFAPFPSYSDEVLVALLAIHTGSWPKKTSPHGLTRFVSWVAATPAPSATSFVTGKAVGGTGLTVRVML